MNTITRKTTGRGSLFQIDGAGPWRNEYKTDSLLANGTYQIVEEGNVVGTWVQTTTGHEIRGN